uniref:Homocysteine-responsive endoplasmic reticulum-resident ubiquitin-like domain member 2 protein n=1 Tax=Fundulus heteroclitus TaxID=8078 RepID=A0A3Q2PPB2_FUNHE
MLSFFPPRSQLLAASSQQLRPDQTSTQSSQSDPLSQRPQAGRHGNPEVQMNAQGGEILNEEELNRDWLDWVYTFSRAAILLSIVYFYSSFSRFVMVMMAMLVLYLHQAGWFPFNLENELQLPGDRANQEEAEPDLQNQDLQEGAEDPNSAPNAGFLSSTWSFIITFFMSLIPEGPQNVAN